MHEQYLRSLIAPLCTFPESVRIVENKDDMGILLMVDMDKKDMGHVIGKAGETVKAIRLLVRIFGMKNGARVSLKING